MRQYGLELATGFSTTSLFRLPPWFFFFYKDLPRMQRAVRREISRILTWHILDIRMHYCAHITTALRKISQGTFIWLFDLDYHFAP